MKQVSVEQAFVWVQRFAQREWPLLVPVALAFMALPSLLVDLLAPRNMQMPLSSLDGSSMQVAVVPLLLSIVVMLLSFVGQLTLLALALLPRISVREALGRAIGRAGVLIAAYLIMFGLVLLAMIVVGVLLRLSPISAVAQQAFLLGLTFGIGLFLFVRLAVLGPLIIEKAMGPTAALRHAWALTNRTFWRLLGAIVTYAFGAGVVVFALSYALGTVVTVAAKMAGQPEVGRVLTGILFNVLMALGGIGLQLLLAALYRQLAGSRGSTGI